MKFISGVFKILAVVMMIVVVIALPLTLVAHDIGRVVYSPEVIETVVNKHLVRIDLMAVILEGAVTGAIGEGDPEDPMSAISVAAFSHMGPEEWIDLARIITPPQIIANMVNEILTGVYGWIDSPNPVPDIRVTFSEIKRVWMQKAVPATELIVNALPQCSAEQLRRIPADWPDGGEILPACRPSEPTYSTVLESVASIMPEFLAEIPDEISLSEADETQAQEYRQAQTFLRRNRFMARVGWVIVIVIYLLAIPAGARSWKDVFTWAGWPLVLVGVIMLFFGIIWSQLADDVYAQFRHTYLAETPRVLIQPITGMMRTFTELMTEPFWGQGLVAIILGTASITVAVVLGRLSKTEEVPAVYELQPDDSPPPYPSGKIEVPSQAAPSAPDWLQDLKAEEDDERPSGMFG